MARIVDNTFAFVRVSPNQRANILLPYRVKANVATISTGGMMIHSLDVMLVTILIDRYPRQYRIDIQDRSHIDMNQRQQMIEAYSDNYHWNN